MDKNFPAKYHKPFFDSRVYHPLSASSDWIDAFEEELSISQTTGLEFILMGDFNIDITHSMNKKLMDIIQLFDLTQLITSLTRVTKSSSTIIDHVYTSNPENITETFVPFYAISDHFQVCLSRKVNAKISKLNISPPLIAVSSLKFDETLFLNDFSSCLEYFKSDWESVDKVMPHGTLFLYSA